jgi:hypothetical protein
MPVYLESQRRGESITGGAQKVSIQYDTDHWEINNWDGNGWITPADQAVFIPEFAVRIVRAYNTEDDSSLIECSLAGHSENVVSFATVVKFENRTIDRYQNNLTYIERVTAVYLTGSASTFTSLSLST